MVRNAVVIAVLSATAALCSARTINVDFNGGNWNDPGATQVGPAVVGQAGDVWNGFSSGQGGALVWSDGSASGATISNVGDGFNYFDPGTSGANANGFYGTPYQNLMRDYLYSPGTLTVSGLPASTSVQLYVYSDPAGDGSGRQTTFTANGVSGTTSPSVPTASTFILGQTYLLLSTATDSTGTLNISFAKAGTSSEIDLNGFQLVVPEPTSLALIALSAGLLIRRRTAQ